LAQGLWLESSGGRDPPGGTLPVRLPPMPPMDQSPVLAWLAASVRILQRRVERLEKCSPSVPVRGLNPEARPFQPQLSKEALAGSWQPLFDDFALDKARLARSGSGSTRPSLAGGGTRVLPSTRSCPTPTSPAPRRCASLSAATTAGGGTSALPCTSACPTSTWPTPTSPAPRRCASLSAATTAGGGTSALPCTSACPTSTWPTPTSPAPRRCASLGAATTAGGGTQAAPTDHRYVYSKYHQGGYYVTDYCKHAKDAADRDFQVFWDTLTAEERDAYLQELQYDAAMASDGDSSVNDD